MSMLLVALYCGGCKRQFEANARSVPVLKGSPACRSCWGLINERRMQLGLEPWETPQDAYPSL
jgi:hypothetical protein